jgi:hypothetical protein
MELISRVPTRVKFCILIVVICVLYQVFSNYILSSRDISSDDNLGSVGFVSDSEDQEIYDLQVAVASLQKRLDELETIKAKDIFNTRTKALENDINNLYTRIDNFKAWGKNYEQKLRNIRYSLNVINNKLEDKIKILEENVQNISNKFDTIENNIKKNEKQNKINQCIRDIINGHINMARKLFYELNDDNLINQIVREAYENKLSNFENVLQFCISSLPHKNQLGLAYDTLFNEMKNNNHLNSDEVLRFGYYIHEAMSMINYNFFDLECPKKFENLKNNLPASIRSIFWSEPVSIINVYYNEYLYAADYEPYDDDRRRVFTWGEQVKCVASDWKIASDDHGKTFTIYNTHQDEYLYVPSWQDFYHVFTWRRKNKISNGYWKLKLESDGSFMIIHTEKGKLFADDYKYTTNRRYVYVLGQRDGFGDTRKMKWRIE